MKNLILIILFLAISEKETKAQLNQKVETVAIEGVIAKNSLLSYSKTKTPPYTPIQIGCICVTEENCPCDKIPPVIIWIPTDQIVRTGTSKKKDHFGKYLSSFEINKSAQIRVEAYLPVGVDAFSKSYLTSLTSGQISNHNKVGAIVDAFSLGWQVGTWIDKQTGASDWLAQKLCDWFGGCPKK